MRRLWRVAWYRLKATAASPVTLALLLLVPVAGAAAARAVTPGAGPAIPVSVVDQDGSEYSRLVTGRLAARSVLAVAVVDEPEALRRVRTRQAEAAFIIRPGFMAAVRSGQWAGAVTLVRSPAALAAEMAGEYLAGEVIRLASNDLAAARVVEEYRRLDRVPPEGAEALRRAVWQHADGYWQPAPLMTIDYRELQAGRAGAAAAPGTRDLPLYGVLASLVLFNALLGAAGVIEDRQGGVLHRVMTTRTSLTVYLLGHALFVFCLGLVSAALALGAAALLGRPPALSPAVGLLVLAYLACAAGLGMLAGAWFRTVAQLQAAAPMLAVLTGLLGSGLSGLGDLSARLEWAARFTPQGWLLAGLRPHLVGGAGMPALPPAVLLGAALACLLLSWRLAVREAAGDWRAAA